MFPRFRLNTLQGIHKFGFSSVAAWCETELSVQIVWSDECDIYPWQRENLIRDSGAPVRSRFGWPREFHRSLFAHNLPN